MYASWMLSLFLGTLSISVAWLWNADFFSVFGCITADTKLDQGTTVCCADICALSNPQRAHVVLRMLTLKPRAFCCAATIFYGIYYEEVIAQYQQLAVVYSTIAPTSSSVLTGSPASFAGALAGNGSLAVPVANTVTAGAVAPPCAGAVCTQSIYALTGNTKYTVSL